MIRIFMALGLKQIISKFTRSNKRGRACIDWIVTNYTYVSKLKCGTYYILISDH